MSCIENLVEVSGPPQASDAAYFAAPCWILAGTLGPELKNMLRLRNGFYAFESALHVFPASATFAGPELNRWNSRELWRFKYVDLADGCLFFAEDSFGSQFCIYDNEVHIFDAETGKKKWLASDLEAWADAVLGDYEYLTGYPLAHEWQQRHGPLPAGTRLVPKLPFVAGGEFDVENLIARDSVKAMRMRGDIASQIRDLPDGTKIEIKTRE